MMAMTTRSSTGVKPSRRPKYTRALPSEWTYEGEASIDSHHPKPWQPTPQGGFPARDEGRGDPPLLRRVPRVSSSSPQGCNMPAQATGLGRVVTTVTVAQ
jgi:hypothetical protein